MAVKRNLVWPLVAGLAIASGAYFGVGGLNQSTQAQTAKPTPQPQVEAVAPASDLSRAFRAVHHSMQDAVVNINVTKKPLAAGTGRNGTRMQIPDELRNMLPPGFDPDQLQGQMQNQTVHGTGSGVIVSGDGYILTNNHVVDAADEVTVNLNDGRELKAEVVGTDPKTDLAVVRVKADHLTFAKFGDSDALEVGDWVLAFGSPFGFSQSMTQGIISAKGRNQLNIIAEHNPALTGMTYENFLQTDAAINPGNSGGPLVNLQGEVVGINAAIASNTGAYNGIGFSIPSNDAQYVMKSLIEHGKVIRGYLGIGIEDFKNPAPEHKGLVESVKRSGFKGDNGILVGTVEESGPAAKAGLELGDVITAVNGKPFRDRDDLRSQIARTAPDSKLTLTVFRDGKIQDISVKVGTQPDSLQPVARAGGRNRAPAAEDSKDLGVTVEDLNPATARQYDVTAKKGVVVTDVSPNSLAASAGLREGDVITKVGKTDVGSAKQFSEAIASAKLSDGVKMVVRGENGMDRLVYVEKR